MLDVGSGPPVVVLPGVQGRWEWMRPAVGALAERCRVLTDSLPGERGSLADLDPRRGFDQHVAWVDALLDRAGLRRAVVCGVSYGGLVALRYAALRPARTAALVIVSSPSPTWQPSCRVDRYLAWPRLLFPVFALSSPLRLYPEIAAAFPNLLRRARFGLQHLHHVTRYPCAPVPMAQRVRLLAGAGLRRGLPARRGAGAGGDGRPGARPRRAGREHPARTSTRSPAGRRTPASPARGTWGS